MSGERKVATKSWKKCGAEYQARFPESSKREKIAWLCRLQRDENFLDETERIREQLEDLLQRDREAAVDFLRRYAMITPLNAGKARLRAQSASSIDTRRVLENYVEYALRFLVYVRLQRNSKRPVDFQPLPRPTGTRLGAKIGEHVSPDVAQSFDEDEESWPYYDALDLHLPPEVTLALRKSHARVVTIRDETTNTVLHEIENWFYDPNSLTFVIHGSKPPVLLCLVGENTRKTQLRDAEQLITAIQRNYFRRKVGGRNKDRAQLKALEEQASSPGRQKEKLDLLGFHAAMSSKRSALSRAKRDIRKRKIP